MNEPVGGKNYRADNSAPVGAAEGVPSVWYLVGQAATTGHVQRVPVHPIPFRIGRRADLSLCIQDKTVSGIHAEITDGRGGLLVRDLESTNGTYVNGTPVVGQAALSENDVVQFAEVVFRLQRGAAKTGGLTVTGQATDRAAALIHFDALMDGQALLPFFQPIVRLDSLHTVGYEVIGRSRLYGLKSPREMFLAAAQLDLQAELSELFRVAGVRAAAVLPAETNVFVNTHPVELSGSGLQESLSQLRQLAGDRPITLEIHEAAVADTTCMSNLESALRDLGIQLAYDDFGAGQARLVELVEVRPDFLKFDMRLVQGIHAAPAQRQQMLATLVEMARGLGIIPLAEGVECEADGLACRQLGFELGQGYHFGRPAPAKKFVEGR